MTALTSTRHDLPPTPLPPPPPQDSARGGFEPHLRALSAPPQAQPDQQHQPPPNKLFHILSLYGEVGQLVAVTVLILLTIHIIASIVWMNTIMEDQAIAASVIVITIRFD